MAAAAPAALAQPAWKPDRPVTIVVPYSPGGGTDALARHVARELARIWGQGVVVENTPGADGLIGSRRVIDSKPDGYTLLVQLPSLTLNRHLPGFKGPDPAAQLIPISIFASLSGVVVTNTAIPGNTLAEVVRHCRTAAQPCSFGTTENIARLQGQMLAVELPSMVVVNYKGGGQLITDLVGNSVNMALMGYTAVIPYQQSGKLRIVMTAGRKRSPVLPDVPTAAESGYPQLEAETWYGLFAPLGTPQPVIDGVAAAVREAVKEESYLKSLALLGASPVGNTPVEFAARVREDSERFGDLVRRFPIQ
jgi:tripartite-type tricarboxylate transporter receptor subunit TctC